MRFFPRARSFSLHPVVGKQPLRSPKSLHTHIHTHSTPYAHRIHATICIRNAPAFALNCEYYVRGSRTKHERSAYDFCASWRMCSGRHSDMQNTFASFLSNYWKFREHTLLHKLSCSIGNLSTKCRTKTYLLPFGRRGTQRRWRCASPLLNRMSAHSRRLVHNIHIRNATPQNKCSPP